MLQLTVAPNLKLKELTVSDAEDLFAAIQNSREHLRTWLPWVDRTRTLADTEEYIKNVVQQQSQQKGLAMGIFVGEELVGSIDMHDWNHELEKVSIGYWLTSGQQQKGIMKQCVTVFIDHLFEQLPLQKIELHIVVGNERSLGLAERLGFKTEGVLRASYKMNGRLHDLVITGLLRNEWPAGGRL